LAKKDPRRVCQRAICDYDPEDSSYRVPVWDGEFIILPNQSKVEPIGNTDSDPRGYFKLVIIHYLLGAKDAGLRNTWISEKDMPGGPTFFRGPHLIPTHLVAERFKNDIEDFQQRCRELNGVSLDMADAAFTFEILPRIPVVVLYWAGDDDFPAESKILYDLSITEHFALDIIYALAVGICERLAKP
jgi:hypothetical protein